MILTGPVYVPPPSPAKASQPVPGPAAPSPRPAFPLLPVLGVFLCLLIPAVWFLASQGPRQPSLTVAGATAASSAVPLAHAPSSAGGLPASGQLPAGPGPDQMAARGPVADAAPGSTPALPPLEPSPEALRLAQRPPEQRVLPERYTPPADRSGENPFPAMEIRSLGYRPAPTIEGSRSEVPPASAKVPVPAKPAAAEPARAATAEPVTPARPAVVEPATVAAVEPVKPARPAVVEPVTVGAVEPVKPARPAVVEPVTVGAVEPVKPARPAVVEPVTVAAVEPVKPARPAAVEPGKTVPASSVGAGPSGSSEIPDVPVRHRGSRTLLGLRKVLQADGWTVSWTGLRQGVTCRSPAGDSLEIIPGRRAARYAGRPIALSCRPVLTRDGQLFVPEDLLNRVLGGRLTVIDRGGASRAGVIRLAAASAVIPPRELSGVPVLRRHGQVLIALRPVLEADGWAVRWEGMKAGAVCRKGETQTLTAIPGRSRLAWNGGVLRGRPPPVVHRQRLFVSVRTLETVLRVRITLPDGDRLPHEARIRLAAL